MLLTRRALDRDRRLRRIADPHGRQIFSDGQPEVIKVSTENLLADKPMAWPKRATARETFVGEINVTSRSSSPTVSLSLSLSLTLLGLKYHLNMAFTYLSVRAKYPVNDLIYRFASFTYYNIAKGTMQVF